MSVRLIAVQLLLLAWLAIWVRSIQLRCNRSFHFRITFRLVIQNKGDEKSPICEDKKPEHIHSEHIRTVYNISSSRFRDAIIFDKNTKDDPNIATAIV